MNFKTCLLAAFFALGAHAQKKSLHFEVEGVGFEMIFVEGGTFTMGANIEQTAPLDNERPLHEVKLSDYYIGETEVTQELWNAVTGQPLSHFRPGPSPAGSASLHSDSSANVERVGQGMEQLPVEDVTWDECIGFIKMLQQKTAVKFCLPTEAQWEFAARGGRYSKGYEYAGSDLADDVAWYGASLRPETTFCPDSIALASYVNPELAHTFPVAQKRPNELGIYDMSGNVAEWTADFYAPYAAGRQKNPKGPAYGTEHVYRGGCWYFGSWASRVTQRSCAPTAAHFCNLGFRLALPKYYKM